MAQKSEQSANITPIVNEREDDDDPNGMIFSQNNGSQALHQLQTVPQKEPDQPPEELG
jgi:hypothetical protein